MKSLIIAFSIFFVLSGAGLYMSFLLQESLTGADQILIEIEQSIKDDNWTHVDELIDQINDYWPDKHNMLAYFIEHDELDKIEYAIARIEGELILKNKDFLYPEIVGLRKIIEQIKGKYGFKFCNIF